MKAAEKGDAEAQLLVGHAYESGKGVKKDKAEAVKWYRRSASQNNCAAILELARCYARGIGVKKDKLQAAEWYRMASDQAEVCTPESLEKMIQASKYIGFDEQAAKEQLEGGFSEAEETLNDPDKMEKLLQQLESKLKLIPLVGEELSAVPAMVSLVRSYYRKEYTQIPVASVIAIISALLYLLAPIDLIPDNIPIIGYVDDATVIKGCLSFVGSDVEKYNAWREENGKILI